MFVFLENYIKRNFTRWVKQYEVSKTQDIPAMTEIMEWIKDNLPENESTTVIHGDFRWVCSPVEQNVFRFYFRMKIEFNLIWQLNVFSLTFFLCVCVCVCDLIDQHTLFHSLFLDTFLFAHLSLSLLACISFSLSIFLLVWFRYANYIFYSLGGALGMTLNCI